MVLTNYKALFNMHETSIILFGPCTTRSTEYNRTLRMCNNGAIDCIMDGGKRYITRKTLEDFMGSEEALKKALQNLDNVVELYPDD
jgi:undecaprenyl pyrophosphate synthase